MAVIDLAGRWRVFFFIELALMAVTGVNWFVNPDSMYTMFGYPAEQDIFSSADWSPRRPVTGQEFAAQTAGQVLCLSYSYVLLRMLLAPTIESTGFKFLLEAMTIGDVAQVYIAAHAYRNGIVAFQHSSAPERHLNYSTVAPSLLGVLLSGGFATFFGIMRIYFLTSRLPELEKPKSD